MVRMSSVQYCFFIAENESVKRSICLLKVCNIALKIKKILLLGGMGNQWKGIRVYRHLNHLTGSHQTIPRPSCLFTYFSISNNTYKVTNDL